MTVHGDGVSKLLRLVCASANPDKVAEIAAILGDAVELLPRPAEVPDVVEDADTLEGNARLKATAICAATGLAAVADDTGLEVLALGGAPGVFAARYAGGECCGWFVCGDGRPGYAGWLGAGYPAAHGLAERRYLDVCQHGGVRGDGRYRPALSGRRLGRYRAI